MRGWWEVGSTLPRGLGWGLGEVCRFCDVFLLEQPNEFTKKKILDPEFTA